MLTCCICEKSLPNKYAVAGTCVEDGCSAVFCALHWNAGNRRCRQHGWLGDARSGHHQVPVKESLHEFPKENSATMSTPDPSLSTPPSPTNETRVRTWTNKHLSGEQAKSMMHAIVEIAGKAGKATGNLVSRLRNGKSPNDMLSEVDAALADNRAKIQPLAEKSETLFRTIAQKKKAYESSPTARKKLLELELRNLLVEYKSIERELTTFYDNEHALGVVRGRVLELMAHSMRRVDEDTVDRIAGSIDEAADNAEAVRDSIRDLDKAGIRRERETDSEAFNDALADFDIDTFEEPLPEAQTTPPITAPPLRTPRESMKDEV